MIGRGYRRVAGQAALHVFLDAGEMADQALHVQVAQRRPRPVRVGQFPQQPVEGVGRAARTPHRVRSARARGRGGPAARARRAAATTRSRSAGRAVTGPAVGSAREAFFARHDDSRNSRSSNVSSLASASLQA